jgi:hypothetical protein
MGMTIPQKKYFVKRIDEMLATKLASVVTVTMDKNMRLFEDFKAGKIQLVSIDAVKNLVEHKLYNCSPASTAWNTRSMNYEDFLVDYDKWEKKFEEEQAELNRQHRLEMEAITAEATKIKDVAIFGSEELAHSMLEDFKQWQWKQDS